MHSQEFNDLTDCCDCRATLAVETDRCFAVDADMVLCFDCAVRRGGAYDAAHDRWTVPPSLAGLPHPQPPRAHARA